MARYIEPKNKMARREGEDLGMKTPGTSAHASLQKRLNIKPGQHGQRRYRKQISDYGIRLREKQKAKRMYGLFEKQFRKYVNNAVKEQENTIDALIEQLERRLDNIVYRLQLVPTRAAARQLVSHRHVQVNDKILNIPSYQVSIGQKISLLDKAKKIPVVEALSNETKQNIPNWLTKNKVSGKMKTLPNSEVINEPIDWQLIIEYYTR